MILNPDNLVILRGKPVHSDFSSYYKVANSKSTTLKFWIKIYSPAKSYKTNKATFEFVEILVFGHVKDKEHPKGGLAEKLLKRVSKKCYVTCYCRLDSSEYLTMYGTKRKSFNVVLEGFRMEDQDIVIRANSSVNKEKRLLDSSEYKSF